MIEYTRTYTTINKDSWGPGPWQNEYDKVQWIDEATGLDCLIVRQQAGHLCGYVGVPPDHPWHGLYYDDLDRPISVHGRITFSGPCEELDDPSISICHIPEPGHPDDVFWFGFDCAHYLNLNDCSPGLHSKNLHNYKKDPSNHLYRDFNYVQTQVQSLAKQLAELTRSNKMEQRCH